MRVVTYFATKWILIALLGGVLVVGIWLSITSQLWVATPQGFEPQIKVSVLARSQARSLEWSAEQHEADGDFGKAQSNWWLAARKNPGNLKYFRRYLTNLRQTEVSPELGKSARLHGDWLLRLTETKSEDVGIVFGALEHCRRYADILSFYARFEEDLAPELRSFQLRAHFQLGHYHQFQTLWNRDPNRFAQDTLLTIYRLGANAILHPTPPAFEALREAYEPIDPYDSRYFQARRIALRAHARGHDIRMCQSS